MDLITAKKEAQKESRAQKGKIVYVVADDEGEVDFSLKQWPTTLHAYKNGSEIAFDAKIAKKSKAVKLSKEAVIGEKENSKNKKQNNLNSKDMATVATKKSAKKVSSSKNGKAAKVATKKESKVVTPSKEKVTGKVKELSVKEIISLLKKGSSVFTEGGVRHNLAYNEKVSDKSAIRRVIVKD